MSINNDKPSFFDRGTIIALVITLVFWLGWSKYMESKHPKAPQQASQEAASAPAPVLPAPNSPKNDPSPVPVESAPNAQARAEEVLEFDSANWGFHISSKGMGIKNIQLKEYKTRSQETVVLGTAKDALSFATRLLDRSELVDFQLQRVDETTFVGLANVDGLQITKTMKINAANFAIETDVKVMGVNPQFRGVVTTIGDVLQEASSGSFLSPSYDHQEWIYLHEGSTSRSVISKGHEFSASEKGVSLAALSAHYFALAVVDRSDWIPRFESTITEQSEAANGLLVYQPVNPADSFSVRYVAFAGPKKFDILKNVDEDLTQVINYGMFAFVAKPILHLLKWLHVVFGNWGWAIIILTIIVRFLVLPFNVYSYRSMKVMQKIQPEIARLKERYKDKPLDQRAQMNQEMMELMKRSGANPVGGCLPMLLQLPVFFALFQVLGQSIELYQAPFALWIHDLSVKDPYYVLPVLMAITMYIQQKITPTTMDPAQAKVMQWMPVIFAVFMVSLPSGLTLYIFVSTLFGIIQQYVFMRDKNPAKTVKEAKA